MTWDPKSQQIATAAYPSLPEPCAFFAATGIGDVIYLACGQRGQSLETARINFWSLGLSKKADPRKFVWKELSPWPGPS